MAKLTEADRGQLIELIVANGTYSDGAKERLAKWEDEDLLQNAASIDRLANAAKPPKAKEEPDDDGDGEEDKIDPKTGKKMVANAAPMLTEEEWLKLQPKSVQKTFVHARNLENREKADMIERVVANMSGSRKAAMVELLKDKDLEELEMFANAMGADDDGSGEEARSVLSFLGAGAGNGAPTPRIPKFGGTGRRLQNQMTPDEKADVLVNPGMDFGASPLKRNG